MCVESLAELFHDIAASASIWFSLQGLKWTPAPHALYGHPVGETRVNVSS